jgi:hypothetical protein
MAVALSGNISNRGASRLGEEGGGRLRAVDRRAVFVAARGNQNGYEDASRRGQRGPRLAASATNQEPWRRSRPRGGSGRRELEARVSESPHEAERKLTALV